MDVVDVVDVVVDAGGGGVGGGLSDGNADGSVAKPTQEVADPRTGRSGL